MGAHKAVEVDPLKMTIVRKIACELWGAVGGLGVGGVVKQMLSFWPDKGPETPRYQGGCRLSTPGLMGQIRGK